MARFVKFLLVSKWVTVYELPSILSFKYVVLQVDADTYLVGWRRCTPTGFRSHARRRGGLLHHRSGKQATQD